MITVHHLLRRYDRDPTTHLAPAAYKALHPMGAFTQRDLSSFPHVKAV
jgi:hypothetical protein